MSPSRHQENHGEGKETRSLLLSTDGGEIDRNEMITDTKLTSQPQEDEGCGAGGM